MKRAQWKFSYPADVLANAAASQAAHRQERVAWWQKKREEVMDKIRSSGVEVTESLAQQYANSTVAGFGPTVSVRGDLQKKLQECHTKIQAHEAAAREYDGWVQVLTANTGASMTLHHDDWLYFFGK